MIGKDGTEMNRSIRVSAKTVDDAITEALIQLGVTSDKLEYEVIEKGSSGFLGIGCKQAVIEARKKEEKEEEPVEDILKEFKESTIKMEKEEFPEKPFHEKKRHTEKKDHGRRDNERRNTEKKEYLKKEIPAPEIHEKELAPVEEHTVKVVEEFLKDVLKAMEMEVEITSAVDEDGSLSIEMKGDNMGILIGKRGQTLDSLQYLANRVANKQQDGYVRVKLDTENYRARRKATLEHLAKNIAYKVKKTRRAVALEPMNPYERRIIHAVLQSDPKVSTHSEGEEPYRKVVVTLNR